MNLEKTVGMYLGKWRNKNPRFKNIKWSTKPVKALGVFHGYAIDLEMIWLEKINKIKSCMEVWKSRDLTYFGKILIIKSFVLSIMQTFNLLRLNKGIHVHHSHPTFILW
jgi:hypothetical protein